MSTKKDYKNRSHGNPNPGGAKGLIWLTTGLAIGLFVAFLVFLSVARNNPEVLVAHSQTPDKAANVEQPERSAKPIVKESGEEPQNTNKGTSYDFYAILPEKEIEISERDLAPSGEDARRQAPKGPWMLQAGSFRRFGDADRLRANLAFQGLESKIDLSTNDAGTWHRVRLGPFDSRREADRIKSRLARSNIDSIILQVRH